MSVCLFVRVNPGYIYGPILKPSIPMDSPWPSDEYKNIKMTIFKKKKFVSKFLFVQTSVCPNLCLSEPLFVRTSVCPNLCLLKPLFAQTIV